MTCRDEILNVANHLAKQSDTGEFLLEDVIRALERKGTSYAESTIRTHVTSRMCKNSPENHAVSYPDLVRTRRGIYRLGP